MGVNLCTKLANLDVSRGNKYWLTFQNLGSDLVDMCMESVLKARIVKNLFSKPTVSFGRVELFTLSDSSLVLCVY